MASKGRIDLRLATQVLVLQRGVALVSDSRN
jgi:hypothetical protein